MSYPLFNKPFDFAAANEHYALNGFPERDPVVGSRSRAVIVTCSDARCSPEHFFKLTEQEASVIRNEGGRAADPGVLRTILLLNCLLEPVKQQISEIMIIHHTDCTALRFTDEGIRKAILGNESNFNGGGGWKAGAYQAAEALAFLPFPPGETERDRLEKSIRDDVRYLQLHPLSKPSIPVSGWIYDLKTRKVERVLC